ncbi:MAG: LPS-assembly protein LptD [Sedimenticola sp.]
MVSTYIAPVQPVSGSRIDEGINWSQCNLPQSATTSAVTALPEGVIQIEADGAELLHDQQLALFDGDVQIRQGSELLEGQHVRYNRTTDDVDSQGGSYLEQKGVRIAGETIHYNLGSRTGRTEQAEYRLLDRTARGSADEAIIDGPGLSHYSNVSYSTCRPGEDDWIIKADELEINQSTGIGTARDTTLAFKGVPFLYTPYFSFPIDDRRMSGFLVPSVGAGDNTGFDLSIPYYFNIAPNMDATFTPRVMAKRGLLLGGEMRYLAKNFQGQINAEILPSDSDRGAGENSNRGAYQLRLGGIPEPRWSYDISADYVSDSDYLDDLGNSLAATSTQYQERRGDLLYHGDGWNFMSRVQSYQTIDNNIALNSRPYSRMPQLTLDWGRPDQLYGLDYHLHSEYVRFDHPSSTKVKAQRIDLKPGISMPLERSWGYLTPKLTLRHTLYNLSDQSAGIASSQSRTLPTLSVNSGLFFDRETNWFGEKIDQTLEPRLYYLYTPYEDQSTLPVFDSSALGLSFGNLFTENRFSGADRVGDANQLTAALTSRSLYGDSGREILRASIGQTLYFRDRDIQLPGVTAANDDSSATFAELAANLGNDWRFASNLQWNPHNNAGIERSALSVNYLDDQQRILNLAHRFTDNSIEQLDLSGRWPVTHRVSLVGRWTHSLRQEQMMEAFAGLEYDSCCWSTRLVARQFRTSATAEPTASIFLQLELKGLTSIGDRVDQFLEKGVLGYRSRR